MDDLLRPLRCPLCQGPLTATEAGLRCPNRHTFDRARAGYVSFRVGRGGGVEGDSAAMVAARLTFLEAGHYAPLTAALVALAPATGQLVEVGAGPAWHLARVLDARPGLVAVALDVSKAAARRAARAHPRLIAVVADAHQPLPLATGCADLVLNVFAPRHGAELRRILAPGGRLVVVVPEAAHLAALRAPLGLLAVDPQKGARVAATLAAFVCKSSESLAWTLDLSRAEAHALAAMGPAGHHDPEGLARRAAALPDRVQATAAVRVEVWTAAQEV